MSFDSTRGLYKRRSQSASTVLLAFVGIRRLAKEDIIIINNNNNHVDPQAGFGPNRDLPTIIEESHNDEHDDDGSDNHSSGI
eukprot:jgi/Psemu1/46113/gm1.46113_g